MPVKADKIYYLSDIFRPDFIPCLPFINFIRDITAFPLQYACGLELNDDFIKTDGELKSANGFDAAEFFRCCGIKISKFARFGHKPGMDEWAALFAADPSEEVLNYLAQYLRDCRLVIGYETPPVLLKSFNLLKIKYIDLRISSIKFFNDLIIGVKTNCPEIFRRILPYKLPEEAIYYKAAQMKARSNIQGRCGFSSEDFALICGQNKGDSSLIFEGRNFSIKDFAAEIKAIASRHKAVYYKRHPSAPADENEFFEKAGVKILPDNLNMYDLLANPRLQKLYAVSSGTLQKAKYFYKEAEYFKSSIYDYIDDEQNICFCERYLNIFQHVMRPYFWASILNCGCENLMTPQAYDEINYENNLRRMLNLYWSYPV